MTRSNNSSRAQKQLFSKNTPLTISQRKNIGKMLAEVLIFIRFHLNQGRYREALELTDAIHNAPALLLEDQFDIEYLKKGFKNYQDKNEFARKYANDLSTIEAHPHVEDIYTIKN
ncbi:MAG: hypothetical protein HQL70_07820 [Magnetococcales bacterium]|nr:hypothetical protein [Magnetococcales bacterium]